MYEVAVAVAVAFDVTPSQVHFTSYCTRLDTQLMRREIGRGKCRLDIASLPKPNKVFQSANFEALLRR